jgi:carbon monoxide dehydrogenase subunit G
VRAVLVGGQVEAPVATVAAVLADPRVYDRMVAGIRQIRWFDPRWPATGSRFRHAVGFGPVAVRDHTEVLAGELPDRLELAVGLGPAGALRMELRLRPSDPGTRVEIVSEPRSGLIERWWSRSIEGLIRRRAAEVVRRLGVMAAERARVQSLDFLDREP